MAHGNFFFKSHYESKIAQLNVGLFCVTTEGNVATTTFPR
jgi:hypothetical protein